MTRPAAKFPRATLLWATLPVVLAVLVYVSVRLQDPAETLELFRRWGYWGMLLLAGTAAVVFVEFWRGQSSLPKLPLTRGEWIGVAVGVMALSLAVHSIETHGARILWDEVRLTGTSMDMFFRQRAGCVEKVQVLAGDVIVSGATIDKRPLLFPFLVSILHSVSGYRPGNAVLLNVILTPVFFTALYVVVRLFARPAAAVCALLLAAGVPVISAGMSGAGFELLNVTLMLVLVIVSWVHAQAPARHTAALLVGAGCLLAHTRYESAIFLGPVAVSLFLHAWRERELPVTGSMGWMIGLLVLLPVQWRVFELNPKLWEMEFRPGSDAVFSASYLPNNLAHAVTFLFGPPQDYGSSWLLSVVGLVGAVAWFVAARRWFKRGAILRDPEFAPWLFVTSFAGHGLLMLLYFYGQFDDGLVSRLAIPLLVFLTIVGVWFVSRIAHDWRTWTIGILVASSYLFAVARPVVSEALLLRRNYLARVCTWLAPTASQLAGKDVLVVDSATYLFWIHHRVQAMTAASIALRPDAFAFHQQHKTFSEIYVVEWLYLDRSRKDFVPLPGHDMSGLFEMEVLQRTLLSPSEAVRISRVKRVDLDELDAWCERHHAGTAAFDIEVYRATLNDPAFFREWGKNLP